MSNKRDDSDFMNLLDEKKKTPEQVADVLGISVRAVYYWIAGKREPRFTIQQVQDLCRLLECSVYELPIDFSRKQHNADRPGAAETIGIKGGDFS